MMVNVSLVGTCNIALLFGSYMMLNSMINDIKNDLNSISESAKTADNRASIFKQLTNFVEFHSNLKELSHFN